jgi:hypothetical protein
MSHFKRSIDEQSIINSRIGCINQPKAEVEFVLNTYNLRTYLRKLSQTNQNETLWNQIFKFPFDSSVLQPDMEYELSTNLESIKNKKLIYSFICHYLGRGIFCSKLVHDRFKSMLKQRLKDAMTDFEVRNNNNLNNENSSNHNELIIHNEISNTFDNHSVEEIISPYIQIVCDYQKWSKEKITWDQFTSEVTFRETVMSKLREKFGRHEINGTNEFFTDFLANLHFDNYCFKSLKNIYNTDTLFTCERSITWLFPLDIEIKVEQKKEILGYRRDSVYTQLKNSIKRLEMNNLEKDLDPYMHGGHIRSLFNNEPLELEYYLKKHPGRQLIAEVSFIMFGLEVQKNPATLIYNMMLIDLIDGDKVTQREVFYTKDHKYTKERGFGGLAPFSFNGATTGARFLNIFYSHIFDHWYSYDITDENEEKIIQHLLDPNSDFNIKRDYKTKIDELMNREYDLVCKWIEFKKERDRKARYFKTVQDIFNYINNKTFEFYEQYKLVINR